MASILNETKAALGLPETHVAFDAELVMFINSVLSRLTQLGVGPSQGFRVTGSSETWEQFMGSTPKLNMVKGYVYMSTKLLFDPPQIGFVLSMMKSELEKTEWLLNVVIEDGDSSGTLDVTAGRPFSQTIRVKNIKGTWPTVEDLEVRAQLRVGPHETDALIANLHTYMTYSYEGNDLVILLSLSGEQTRTLLARQWGTTRLGYFNIVISDVGTVDTRAIVVPLITLRAVDTTVRGSGLL